MKKIIILAMLFGGVFQAQAFEAPFMTCYIKGKSSDIKEISFAKLSPQTTDVVGIILRNPETIKGKFQPKVFISTKVKLILDRAAGKGVFSGNLEYFEDHKFSAELDLNNEDQSIDLFGEKPLSCKLHKGVIEEY